MAGILPLLVVPKTITQEGGDRTLLNCLLGTGNYLNICNLDIYCMYDNGKVKSPRFSISVYLNLPYQPHLYLNAKNGLKYSTVHRSLKHISARNKRKLLADKA